MNDKRWRRGGVERNGERGQRMRRIWHEREFWKMQEEASEGECKRGGERRGMDGWMDGQQGSVGNIR